VIASGEPGRERKKKGEKKERWWEGKHKARQ